MITGGQASVKCDIRHIENARVALDRVRARESFRQEKNHETQGRDFSQLAGTGRLQPRRCGAHHPERLAVRASGDLGDRANLPQALAQKPDVVRAAAARL